MTGSAGASERFYSMLEQHPQLLDIPALAAAVAEIRRLMPTVRTPCLAARPEQRPEIICLSCACALAAFALIERHR